MHFKLQCNIRLNKLFFALGNKVLGFLNFTIKIRGNSMHFKCQCNISETESGIFAFFALGNKGLGFRNSTIKIRGSFMHFKLKCNINETE